MKLVRKGFFLYCFVALVVLFFTACKQPAGNIPVEPGTDSVVSGFPIIPDDSTESGIGFSYTFNLPQDETINLAGAQSLSWINNDEFCITVEGSYDSYQWYVDGMLIAGNGNTIKIYAQNYDIREHNLTLKVTKDGVPYTKTITFTVE